VTLVLIGCDLRSPCRHRPLQALRAEWRASQLLESVWLASLGGGTAAAVRNALRGAVAEEDPVAVVGLRPGSDRGLPPREAGRRGVTARARGGLARPPAGRSTGPSRTWALARPRPSRRAGAAEGRVRASLVGQLVQPWA
jgi:hypothetical protein